MIPDQYDYGSLTCRNLEEAHRLIRIMDRDLRIHGCGKKFWMWMFLAQVFVSPIIGPFFNGFWKGLFS